MSVRVRLHGYADVETGSVVFEVGGGEVGVEGVGDVGGDKEAARVGAGEEVRLRAGGEGAEGFVDEGDGVGQEVAVRALPEERADFFVVEEADDFEDAAWGRGGGAGVVGEAGGGGGGEEGFDGGEGAEFVVDAAGEDEFFVEAAELGGLCVEELEFPVYDCADLLDLEFAGDSIDEPFGLSGGEGAGAAEERGFGCFGFVGPADVAVVKADYGHHLCLEIEGAM